jgi:hypothetical protein
MHARCAEIEQKYAPQLVAMRDDDVAISKRSARRWGRVFTPPGDQNAFGRLLWSASRFSSQKHFEPQGYVGVNAAGDQDGPIGFLRRHGAEKQNLVKSDSQAKLDRA